MFLPVSESAVSFKIRVLNYKNLLVHELSIFLPCLSSGEITARTQPEIDIDRWKPVRQYSFISAER